MEFRIFLPCVCESDYEKIEHNLLQQYAEAIGVLWRMFESASTSGIHPEKRQDKYLVGPPYLGLKYRKGRQLELKVRTAGPHSENYWIESWCKWVLGAGHPADYSETIMAKVLEKGHSEDTSNNDDVVASLEDPSSLTIQKERVCLVDNSGLDLELCSLSLVSSEAKTAGQLSAAGTQTPARSWVSVCIEGQSSAHISSMIENSIIQNQAQRQMWDALLLGKVILAKHTEVAIDQGFFPVLSGYPQWVSLCSGLSPFSGAEIGEILLRPLNHFSRWLCDQHSETQELVASLESDEEGRSGEGKIENEGGGISLGGDDQEEETKIHQKDLSSSDEKQH